MYSNLKNIGVTNYSDITRYSLRREGNNDTLKIYFKKDKNSRNFLARSTKFKFPRQGKTIHDNQSSQGFRTVSEINSVLLYIIKELDSLTVQVKSEKEIKLQILDDLKHLETVVASKIKEIEDKLEKL
ncbi:MAG: DUF3461 family protein [Psychromonas sp.]